MSSFRDRWSPITVEQALELNITVEQALELNEAAERYCSHEVTAVGGGNL